MRTFVYFVLCNDEFIKIGVSASPAERLKDMQVGNPYALSLEYFEEGSFSEESRYHHTFRNHRTQGEWFAYHGKLKKWVDEQRDAQQKRFESED
jgi:hypothetical protein